MGKWLLAARIALCRSPVCTTRRSNILLGRGLFSPEMSHILANFPVSECYPEAMCLNNRHNQETTFTTLVVGLFQQSGVVCHIYCNLGLNFTSWTFPRKLMLPRYLACSKLSENILSARNLKIWTRDVFPIRFSIWMKRRVIFGRFW